MYRFSIALAFAASLNAAPVNSAVAADSSRGQELFQSLDCIQCHTINGQGGKIGPDLSKRLDRGFTPSTLAATMWNHAPAMFGAIEKQAAGLGGNTAASHNAMAGHMDDQAALDLFAYFYSVHFFDKPGDAGRGKRVFSADHCSVCHGLTESKTPGAKPVSDWSSIGQPIQFVDAMWNHAATMREEFSKRKLKWPELTSQDLTDLLVWVRNLPITQGLKTQVEITAGSSGDALFTSKGCAACHTGDNVLGPKLKGDTLNDIAAAMWNHEPKMAASAPQLTSAEMRDLVSSLWAGEFLEDAGNASAGERVFSAKHCTNCHGPNGTAPQLSGRNLNGATMISALWRHGPQMLDQMKAKGVTWPRFEGQDMADLIAYLNRGK